MPITHVTVSGRPIGSEVKLRTGEMRTFFKHKAYLWFDDEEHPKKFYFSCDEFSHYDEGVKYHFHTDSIVLDENEKLAFHLYNTVLVPLVPKVSQKAA